MPDLASNSTLTAQLVEEFGANASYAETLLDRYLSSPTLVEESWRGYFAELLASPLGQEIVAAKTSNANGQVSIPNGTNANGSNGHAPASTVQPTALATGKKIPISSLEGAEVLRGGPKKIVENMEQSLTVPVATSQRVVPVKLLDENRQIINEHLAKRGGGKTSYTHIIAWAIVKAMERFPQMNDGFFLTDEGPARVKRADINIGIAIDVQKKDGSRTLLVPNVKRANAMNFADFLKAYDDVVQRARLGKLEVSDFAGSTLSLTNPGTIGTVGSVPRLMSGQAMIIATGAIEYPAEYQAMAPEALSQLGISKVVQVSNTYDHRIIQGAESGAMLARMHELLLGKDGFYESIFDDLSVPVRPFHWAVDSNPALLMSEARERLQMRKQASVLELINAYRVRGHLIADTDPLHSLKVSYNAELDIETYGLTIWDLDREYNTGGLAGLETATLRKILLTLRRAYCGTVGIEYRHIQSREEKQWLRSRIEREQEPVPVEIRKQMLWKLISAEQFESFVHKNYLGQKRFSVEGNEVIIPLLDQLIERSVEHGTEDITIGMAHRGRLNVVANVIGHYCERIFTAFEGSVHPNFPADEGDVKYHQGASGARDTQGKTVKLTLANNPSHLEAVDPVIEGMVRAKQDASGGPGAESWNKILPVLLHGDAAFAGQGVVMETLNLASLKGYRVGGTIHIIVNNQIGFTTSPSEGRSTVYSTDIARMTMLPIFHINADDPDAVFRVLRIALEFRTKFCKDIVLDIIGFRRLGHNEADEPSYTQPLMYQRVKAHPGVRSIYANRLIAEKVVTEDEVKGLIDERIRRYNDALARAKAVVAAVPPITAIPAPPEELDGSAVLDTAVARPVLDSITTQISIVPESFHLNPKMVSQLARRAKMGSGQTPADWAFGEALAFGSLVLEGYNVRLSGQDSGRGTFSQRHAAMYDTENGSQWIPLAHLTEAKARFEVYDSSLSEEAVMGFEYGYSLIAERDLVIWEAQFGDFANGAQVVIDQFIAAAEHKWGQRSRLVLLLPHGFEGQGPEHSSARLERFLQLSSENNWQVVNPTTPAQYFHLLRRQVHQQKMMPLVTMTPKSLLRLPAAGSPIEEFSTGGFRSVIEDAAADKQQVKKIVLCSGKVYYDLLEAKKSAETNHVAIVRLEQFYPFPAEALRALVASYSTGVEIVWVQEEPMNMGGWTFVEPRLRSLCSQVRFIGRPASPSPATGVYSIHQLEQQRIVTEALA